RGFEPNAPTIKLLPEYLEEAPRTGRLRMQEAIQEAAIKRSSRSQRFIYNSVESPQSSRVQQDQANEEAWVDEEDETGET
ncbi:HTH-Tnp-Tc3-2 domain containing protein, partial [Pyrenophora tritici-repentis]